MFHLLRPFTGTGSIFFPVLPPPEGTCEFATSSCCKYCYVNDHSNFDEETRIPQEIKRQIYQLVMTLPIKVLWQWFLNDLEGLQTHILSWFGSGDCLTKDVDRISEIIEQAPSSIIQMGFTRNKKLWKRYKNIFALSIESEKDATDTEAMYSIPDYESETSVMYCPSYEVRGGFCGPIVCTDRDRNRKDLTHYINCKICYRLKTGCFDRRKVIY